MPGGAGDGARGGACGVRWRARAYRVFPVEQPIRDLAPALQEFDPAILTAYPSALRLLADEQRAGRMRLRPVLVETAGESMAAEDRAEAAAVFGCTIHDAYAASECQWMAADCAEGLLHVNSDWAILEPVDEDHRPVPPGEPSHTVLVTNLANQVQPIIRYDLGDSVLARPEPCPCGSALPALRVVGRRGEVLKLQSADGSTVDVLPSPSAPRSRRLRAFLAAQGLGNVTVLRDSSPPERGGAGKFRQVIARSQAPRA